MKQKSLKPIELTEFEILNAANEVLKKTGYRLYWERPEIGHDFTEIEAFDVNAELAKAIQKQLSTAG